MRINVEKRAQGRMRANPKYFFIRLDIKDFHEVTEILGIKKPFDRRIAACFIKSAEELFRLQPELVLVYAFSDELNLLFEDGGKNGEAERISSTLIGMVSRTFTKEIGAVYGKRRRITFDSQVYLTPEASVAQYLDSRQKAAWRNYLKTYAYWQMVDKGVEPPRARERLKKLETESVQRLLNSYGVPTNGKLVWESRGTLVYRESQRSDAEESMRDRLIEDWSPPQISSEVGKKLLKDILENRKVNR